MMNQTNVCYEMENVARCVCLSCAHLESTERPWLTQGIFCFPRISAMLAMPYTEQEKLPCLFTSISIVLYYFIFLVDACNYWNVLVHLLKDLSSSVSMQI